MERPSDDVAGQVSGMEHLESRIAVALDQTAREVARAECFDAEQRSEVYAILASMRADSQAHRDLVGRWVNDRSGDTANV